MNVRPERPVLGDDQGVGIDAEQAAPARPCSTARARTRPPDLATGPADGTAGARFAQGSLLVLVGPPAAGKSTWAAQVPPTWRVCLDGYRGLLTDSEADQGANEEALALRALVLEGRLRRGRTTVCDSTSIEPAARAGLLACARRHGRPAIAVLFDTPLALCETRNAARQRTVPIQVLRDMHAKLPDAEQLRSEGFDAVHHPPAAAALLAEPARVRGGVEG